jgi:Putative auto-transporter adhesin, head GIN domain
MTRKLMLIAAGGLIAAPILLTLGSFLSEEDWASAANWWPAGRSTCGSTTSARGQITLPLTASDNLAIALPASVRYQPGAKGEAVVSGDAALLNHVRIDGGRLSLDCDPGWFAPRFDIALTGPAIASWEVLGSADLSLAQINQPQLRVSIRGSGSIAAAGIADTVGLEISGSGKAELKSLTAKSARVEIRGSGDAQITAEEDADVLISGSGDVELFGHPKLRRSEVRGSGSIVQVP